MSLPLTPELRDYPIPNLRVDVSSHSNLRVVASSFFPASELLSISLIPNLRVVVYPFHIRPRSCMFPFSNLSVVALLQPQCCYPFPASELLLLLSLTNLRVLWSPFRIPTPELMVTFLIYSLRVVSPFSNRGVVAHFPTAVL